MSALPAQVQAQGEAADRMLADLAKPPETPQPAEPPAPTTEVQPSPASAPAPAAPAATEQPKPADEATWEHRYKTLQGMFSAQKQRDEEARKSLENQLRDALARIAELEQAAKKPAEQPQPKQPLVTEKDTEAFGADLIDLARRIAQDTVQQQMGEVEKLVAAKDREIAELRKQLGGVAEQTKVVGQHTYLSELTKAVPDWEAINTSQSWLEWLAQPDPLSGRPRQDFLDDAFARQDVLRTAQIFNAFKATRTAQPPAPQVNPELQRQVQPATSQAAPIAPTANADAKIWTAAEVGQFYDDVAKGKYRGKEAEMNRISAEIDAAIASGRVR